MPANSARSRSPRPGASPTLRRWELAARLRELRLDAGRSVEEVAGELMCSAAKISRMETAGRGVQTRDVRDLARFYRLPDSVRDELMSLATEAKRPGWWQEYRSLDETTAQFVGLEASATDLLALKALLVPGLLQTPDYTRAVMPSLRPPGTNTPEAVEEAVSVRQRRQERVSDGSLRVSFLIDESALARSVGKPEVMRGQVGLLIEFADLPTVTLQVVPFSCGPHPGLDGSFSLMEFGSGQIGDVVFVEGLLGYFLVDKEFEVSRYQQVFEYVSKTVALDRESSQTWLRRYWDHLPRS